MGNCLSERIEADPAEKERDERIKGVLAKDKENLSRLVKLLLLGAGESGMLFLDMC
jgi:hypothetical protein